MTPSSTMAKKTAVIGPQDIELVVVEQPGCEYCELWDEQVGIVYHKTPEGRFAPLKRVQIHHIPKNLELLPVTYTPTFVVIRNRKEIGRLIGYISEDFFWQMLADILKKTGFKSTG